MENRALDAKKIILKSVIEKPECCPKFDPAPWDGKVFEWKDKKFIKDHVSTIFYMPLNFGGVIVG